MAMKSTAIALLAACLGLCDAAKPPAKPNVLTMLCVPVTPLSPCADPLRAPPHCRMCSALWYFGR